MNAVAKKSVPVLTEDSKLLLLDPKDVWVPERIGFYHEDVAAHFGHLIKSDGQRDPIKVFAQPKDGKPWRLVTGRHRHAGGLIQGLPIFAIEVFGKAEDLDHLEASENLHRRKLAPIERASFTAALVKAAQERIAREHGELSHQKLGAKARWERVKRQEIGAEEALTEETGDAYAKMAQAYGWEDSVGEALGMSRRSIHRDLELFRLVIEPFPDLAEALSKHPVVGENASQLRAIARVKDEAKRREVVEALLANSQINADDARIAAGVDAERGVAPTPAQKHTNAIDNGWSRLSLSEKRRYLPRFVEKLTPDMKAQLRELLDEEQD
ncbi:hypothetical protein AAG593_09460 [Citromicrobium bathyomarinum]